MEKKNTFAKQLRLKPPLPIKSMIPNDLHKSLSVKFNGFFLISRLKKCKNRKKTLPSVGVDVQITYSYSFKYQKVKTEH